MKNIQNSLYIYAGGCHCSRRISPIKAHKWVTEMMDRLLDKYKANVNLSLHRLV